MKIYRNTKYVPDMIDYRNISEIAKVMNMNNGKIFIISESFFDEDEVQVKHKKLVISYGSYEFFRIPSNIKIYLCDNKSLGFIMCICEASNSDGYVMYGILNKDYDIIPKEYEYIGKI